MHFGASRDEKDRGIEHYIQYNNYLPTQQDYHHLNYALERNSALRKSHVPEFSIHIVLS